MTGAAPYASLFASFELRPAATPHVDETLPLQSKPPRRRSAPLGALVRVLNAQADPPSLRMTGRAICRIGSAPGCDIVISDPTVSRAHVELALVEHGVSVVDLGSRNGTFYLGQRVQRMVLALGSRIELGAAQIGVDADSAALYEGLEYAGDSYRSMIGVSGPMRRLFAILSRLEGSLATVLIEGESGVGKEGVARAVHDGSAAAAGPLVILNCGALPRELVASELFGHKKGAFTGAVEARRGAFDSANGGTPFLDEIGELPLDVQPMLLRALETGEVRAIGGDEPRRVSVRVIAATNRDLEREVQEGRFREDLFYRLAVIRVAVPPLRERVADIPGLAELFAREAGVSSVPDDVLEELKSRSWPGNARQLRNTMQAFAALGVLPQATRSKAATLDLALRELVDPKVAYGDQKDALVDRFTAAYLSVLMETTGGNQTAAARLAGLDRGYLGKLLAKYGTTRRGRGGE